MKWLGALLFIGTTTWIGFEWSNELTKRPQHIRQLKNALQILEAEILYSQSPLQEAFDIISKQVPEPARSFFANLSDRMTQQTTQFMSIWDEQVDVFIKQSSLGNEEKEIMKQFGRTLGQHDFHQQQKHIHLTISHLDREMADARDHSLRYGKMAKSLGFLCGLFIVLLLI